MEFDHIRIGTASAPDVGIEGDDEIVKAGAIGRDEQDDRHGMHEGQRHSTREEDAYTPTTLEDIESSKMPKIQVAVLVVALACLAIFAVWYILGI